MIAAIIELVRDLLRIAAGVAAGQLGEEEARQAARQRIVTADQQLERLPADQAGDYEVLCSQNSRIAKP